MSNLRENQIKSIARRLGWWLVGVVSATVLVMVGVKEIDWIFDKFTTENTVNSALDKEIKKADSPGVGANFALALELENWKKKNQDVAFKIEVPGTKINYLVTHRLNDQSGDFYLRRNLDKNYAVGGALFLDKKNQADLSDDNLIIYGHNMPDGTMFGDLEKYRKREFYEQNRRIKLSRLVDVEKKIIEEREYEIFAVIVTRVKRKKEPGFRYYYYLNAKDENEFRVAVEEVKRMMIYPTEIMNDLRYKEQWITLSTCEYSQEKGRLAVFGRLVEKKQN